MITFVADGDEDFRKQIAKFCLNYPQFASVLNINATLISNLNKANAVVQFVFAQQEDLASTGTEFTSYKNLLRSGNGDEVLGAYPVLSVYPAVEPPLCNANVESQLRGVIQACVATKLLTETMGIALGIVAPAATAPDLTAGTPNLTVKPTTGGHPLLHANIGNYDAYEIWKDTGTGFVFYNVTTSPNFTDTAPLPAIGVNEIWNYKGIYRYKNKQIGNWSDTVTITVKGSI